MNRRFLRYLGAAAALLALSHININAEEFTYGADPSWMTFQEQKGIKFYQADETTESTVEDLLKEYGFTAARLRVWVNPENYNSAGELTTGSFCNKEDVLAKARRLSAKGLDIMLCFHFSDTWADPSKQRIPQAWAADAQDLDALTAHAVGHVQEICNALKEEGIPVKWVQIGNEDGTGFMLHDADGNAIEGCLTGVGSSGSAGFIHVFNAAAKAAREIYPEVKTVHHLANGQNWGKLSWNLQKTCPADGSVEKGTRLDADYVGLSLYPLAGSDDTQAWTTNAQNCLAAINSIYSTYGLRTLVVEVGMNNDYSTRTAGTSQMAHSAQCSEDVAAFAEYFVAGARRSGVCDGVFYWEPQSSYLDMTTATGTNGNGGYKLGAMLDVERKSTSWGSRTRLAPNGYWDMIKQLASGYEPEPEPEPETGEWNLKYSLDDKATWTTVPFEYDNASGFYTLTGLSDETAQWCMNYYIINGDASESYIACEGVKADTQYPLYSTLSGTYQGWSGWLQDKWLEPKHTFLLDAANKTLMISDNYTGVEMTGAETNEAVRYYNLQGIEVTTPQPGQIVIRRQGTRATVEVSR